MPPSLVSRRGAIRLWLLPLGLLWLACTACGPSGPVPDAAGGSGGSAGGGGSAGSGGEGGASGQAGTAGSSAGGGEAGGGGAGAGVCGECPAATPKCNRKGECVASAWCESNADCSGSEPYCRTSYPGGCSPCLTDEHCPASAPHCLPDWEFNGQSCVQCAADDPAGCPPGLWCNAPIRMHVAGICTTSKCGVYYEAVSCQNCLEGTKRLSVGPGGACESKQNELRQCVEEASPGSGCYPSSPDAQPPCPVPAACTSALDAVKSCAQAAAIAGCP